MTAFQWANVIEAFVWPSIGVGVAAIGKKKGMSSREVAVTVGTLVIFGISDLVEAQTGAWYRPWWLFLWKAICVGVLLCVVFRAFQRGKKLG